MRKIVNSTYTTLDGDITNMQRWHFDFFTESDESGAAAHDLMFGSDALIMGARPTRASPPPGPNGPAPTRPPTG